jgi:hypothetical protein
VSAHRDRQPACRLALADLATRLHRAQLEGEQVPERPSLPFGLRFRLLRTGILSLVRWCDRDVDPSGSTGSHRTGVDIGHKTAAEGGLNAERFLIDRDPWDPHARQFPRPGWLTQRGMTFAEWGGAIRYRPKQRVAGAVHHGSS